MSIPEPELESLIGDGLDYSIVPEGNLVCLVIQKFGLPTGYGLAESDLLLRLPAGCVLPLLGIFREVFQDHSPSSRPNAVNNTRR